MKKKLGAREIALFYCSPFLSLYTKRKLSPRFSSPKHPRPFITAFPPSRAAQSSSPPLSTHTHARARTLVTIYLFSRNVQLSREREIRQAIIGGRRSRAEILVIFSHDETNKLSLSLSLSLSFPRGRVALREG